MRCKFVVGQKVICTKKSPWRRCLDGAISGGPVDGEICTIREIEPFSYLSGYIGLRVQGHDGWFNYIHFKPLDERRTDISIFKKLLNPTKVMEPV